MATVNPTNALVGTKDGSAILWTWANLTSTNADGAPVQFPEWADRTWQVVGTFDSATVTLQGSLDGTNWFTLSNAAGAAAATFTAAGGKTVIELPLYMRPLTSGGAGSQNLTVMLLMRRANPQRQ